MKVVLLLLALLGVTLVSSTCIRDKKRVANAQEALVILKQKILVDGLWGPKSLGALNAVQKQYKLDKSRCLRQEDYKFLLKIVLEIMKTIDESMGEVKKVVSNGAGEMGPKPVEDGGKPGAAQEGEKPRVSAAFEHTKDSNPLAFLVQTPDRAEDQKWSKPSRWNNQATRDAGARGTFGAFSDLGASKFLGSSRGSLGLSFRGARWAMDSAGWHDTAVRAATERAMRYADIAHGVHLMRNGQASKGAFLAFQQLGRVLGGEKGDQVSSLGLAGSQMLQTKGFDVAGAKKGQLGTKIGRGAAITSGLLGATWAAGILLRDKKAAEAIQKPFMGSMMASIAVQDARNAHAAYKGYKKAPSVRSEGRISRALTKRVVGGYNAAKSGAVKVVSKTAAGRAGMKLGAKALATAGGRAIASFGPAGILIRGHSLVMAGVHVASGNWGKAGIAVLDAALFGEGSTHLIVNGGKAVWDCAKNHRECAREIAAFGKRSGKKIAAAAKKAQECMKKHKRAECIAKTKAYLKKTGASIVKGVKMGAKAFAKYAHKGYKNVKKNLKKAGDHVTKKVTAAKDHVVKKVTAAKNHVVKKMTAAKNHVVKKYRSAKKTASKHYNRAKKSLSDGYDSAKKSLTEFFSFGK